MLTRKQYQLLMFIDRRLKETGVSPSFDEMKEALGLKSKSGIHRLITALEERNFLRRLPHRARALEVLRLPENLAAGFAGAGEAAPSPHAASPAPVDSGDAQPRRPRTLDRPDREPALGEAPSAELPSADLPFADLPSADLPSADLPSADLPSNVVKPSFKRVPPASGVSDVVQLPLYGRIAAGTPIEALRDQSRTIGLPSGLLGSGDHYALEVDGDSMIEAGIFDGDTVIIRRCDNAENGAIVVALVDREEVTLKRLRRRGQSIALEPANALYETRICGPDQVQVQGRLVGLFRRY